MSGPASEARLEGYRLRVQAKREAAAALGFDVDEGELPTRMHPHQRHCTAFALRQGRSAMFLDTGLGKAIQNGWPVATPEGWRAIETLQVGDRVFGVDGKPRRVLGVFPQGERRLFRVTFSDGAETVCDGDHLWTVNTKLRRSRGLPWRTLTLTAICQQGLRDGMGWRHFVPMCAPVSYPPADLPVEPYTLGALIGDGSLGNGVVRITTDAEIVSMLTLPKGVSARFSRSAGKAGTWSLVFSGGGQRNPLRQSLDALGLTGGSHEKRIPPEYLFGSVAQRLALLQGLMDTDGHANPKGNLEWGSTSEGLARDVVQLVQSLGGTARMRVKPAPKFTYRGSRRVGRPYFRMSVRLPSGVEAFRLPRKRDAWVRLTKYQPVRAIVAVEPIGAGLATCIKIDAEDGLFLLRDYVVTHNTGVALEWARRCVERENKPALMLSPLAVAAQHALEAERWGIEASVAREQAQVVRPQIYLANYERLHLFDASAFGAVVIDESSALKGMSGATSKALIETFSRTRYRLAATATPAPNDHMEIGQHSAFLGVMRQTMMLNRWFIRDSADTGQWRMKGHAVKDFWSWVASWSRCVSRPSDLGFCDEGFELPPLRLRRHVVEVDRSEDAGAERDGQARLFRMPEGSATSMHGEKRKTMDARADVIAAQVAAEPAEPWLIWCDTDAEADALMDRLGGDALEVRGSMAPELKEERLLAFARGELRVLVTKPRIAGFGLNFQHCARQAFVGLSYSYEAFYQAVRRSWRYGQRRPVEVHAAIAETELAVWASIARKADAHDEMKREMREAMRRAVKAQPQSDYAPSKPLHLPEFLA